MIARDKAKWLTRNEEATDEAIEENLKQYRTTRRLWKQEARFHEENIEELIKEREARRAAANEEIAKLQEDVAGKTKI